MHSFALTLNIFLLGKGRQTAFINIKFNLQNGALEAVVSKYPNKQTLWSFEYVEGVLQETERMEAYGWIVIFKHRASGVCA